MENNNWWKRSVIYQVYPRSFADSNGDGVGDLPGVVSKLDYLKTLGIDAIWLSPVYRSPQYDNGYDISDYRDVDPLFGTLADLDRLIAEAKARGIRIILDLVLNHTSDEHPWFLSAKQSRESPYHDYYIWRDPAPGEEKDGETADFGAGAWQYVPELGQYFYYQFSHRQPDLNWANPRVREELYDMIRWWTARGVGGYRLDVVDHLAKDPFAGYTINGPRLHEFVREMSAAAFPAPLVTVGEAWSATIERAKLYANPDGSELSMVFQFEHLLLDKAEGGEKWDLAPLPLNKLKQVFERWQTGLHGCGWNSLFWENHDIPRIVSRWGDEGEFREASAKMLAVLLFGMEGTPYIYEGQELGMTNRHFALDDYQDVETLDMIRTRRAKGYSDAEILRSAYGRSRDNARTPMQWDASPNAGFTTGTPWLPVNENYKEINAAEQIGRADSVFECYRNLIALRKEYPVFEEGEFTLLEPENDDLFAYKRETEAETLLVLCNFTGKEIENPISAEGMTLLLGTYGDDQSETLRPYEARLYRKGD